MSDRWRPRAPAVTLERPASRVRHAVGSASPAAGAPTAAPGPSPSLLDGVDLPSVLAPLPARVWIFNHYAATPLEPGGTRHHSLAKELRSSRL